MLSAKYQTVRPVLLLVAALCIGRVGSADPTVNVVRAAGAPRPHQPYTVTYQLSWTGDAKEYAILPGEAEAIDWGSMTLKETRGVNRDGKNVVEQVFEITPNQSGEFKVPQVRFAYSPFQKLTPPAGPDSASRASAPGGSPTLRAEAFSLLVQPNRTLSWTLGGVSSILAFTLLTWWALFYRRGRRHARSEILRFPQNDQPGYAANDAARLTEAETALRSARRHLLDGELYECYKALAQAAAQVPSCPAELRTNLQKRVQETGYGGVRPQADEVEGHCRAVERALRQAKESESE